MVRFLYLKMTPDELYQFSDCLLFVVCCCCCPGISQDHNKRAPSPTATLRLPSHHHGQQ